MIRLPKPAGLVPSALLFVCALGATQSNAADGTWQEFNLLQVSSSLATYDGSHDQLLSVGGFPRQDNWALSLTGQRAWEPLPAAAEEPIAAYCALDESTGLIYYIGDGPSGREMHTLDALTGSVTAIPGSRLPFTLSRAPVLAFDGAEHRLVLFDPGDPYNDPPQEAQTWALELTPSPAWTRWLPAGTPPPPAFAGFMSFAHPVVDPVRRRIVYPLSLSDDFTPPFSIWVLTVDGPPQWQHFETNGSPDGSPYPRNPAVIDVSGDRLVTLGAQGDLYALSLATFQWSATPARNEGPALRVDAGIAIDPARHRMLVNGGTSLTYDTYNDAWALSLDHAPVWTKLVTDAVRAPIRSRASDGFDASRHRLVVFGGAGKGVGSRNDTWLVDLRKDPVWSALATLGTPPRPRNLHVSAWDPVRDQLIVFGGLDDSGVIPQALGDLWALSFARGTPTWSQVVPAGPAPPARFSSQLVYDTSRDRFLLIGGSTLRESFDDVWELRMAPSPVWRRLSPAGASPGALDGHMCQYDPARDRVLIVGAVDNDVWALALGSGDGEWEPLHVAPGPSERDRGLLRLDTTRDRLLLFGGFGLNSQGDLFTWLNDTWALDLAGTPAWNQLSPAGVLPPARDGANGAYDAAHDRLVVAAGVVDGSNDLWTLAFPNAPVATQPPHGAGQQGSGAAQTQTSPLTLGMSVKAAVGRVTFAVQLPSADPATLALFDIAGRTVWSKPVGQLGAGSHEVRMNGAGLSPAIYFARLSQGRATRYARIAITQ